MILGFDIGLTLFTLTLVWHWHLILVCFHIPFSLSNSNKQSNTYVYILKSEKALKNVTPCFKFLFSTQILSTHVAKYIQRNVA